MATLPTTLHGRSLKVTVLLDPAEIAALRAPEGQPRTRLQVRAGGRMVTADVNSKSVRKAIATIREYGPDGCVLMLQGKLDHADVIQECGLAAQLKTPKEAAPANGTPQHPQSFMGGPRREVAK
jgi:hypothetical protein